MSFQSLASLWWLAPVLGAIIALYLLKMRRTDVRVPATFLWPRITADVRANALFQKLRFSLLLLLQILVACLVIVALADPTRTVHGLSGSATVIVLDSSLGMNATDVSPSRYVFAEKRVQGIIDAMSGTDRLALIEAGADTRVVFPLSNDHAMMTRALRQIVPSDATCDMGDALRLASALVSNRPNARIVLLSDGDFPIVTDFSPGKAQLVYEPIGTMSRNVAVTAFDSSLAPTGNSIQCFASIRNYAADPTIATVTFKVDGDVTDARQIKIAAGQSVGETFSAPPSTREATVEVTSPGDILIADNQATIYLKGAGAVRTLLVSNGNLFLERALSLDPSVRLERAPSVPDYEKASAPGDGRYDLVIFDGVAPEPVKAPAVWSLGEPSQLVGVADDGMLQHPAVVDWSRDDPVMRYTDFSTMSIDKAHNVGLLTGSKTLMQTTGGAPLIVSAQPRGRRTLYCAWNVLDSDFPLRVSFPIFVGNAVAWLTTGQGSAGSQAGGIVARPGMPFNLTLPGNGSWTLIHPDGSREALDTGTGVATVRSANTAGIYTAQSGKSFVKIAVNVLDQDTSDVAPRSSLNLGGAEIAATKTPGLTLSEIWRPLIMAALLLLCAEWWVFVRRS